MRSPNSLIRRIGRGMLDTRMFESLEQVGEIRKGWKSYITRGSLMIHVAGLPPATCQTQLEERSFSLT